MFLFKWALIGWLSTFSVILWSAGAPSFSEYVPDQVIPVYIAGTKPSGYLLIFYGQSRLKTTSTQLSMSAQPGYRASLLAHGAINPGNEPISTLTRFGDRAPTLSFLGPAGFNLAASSTLLPAILGREGPWKVAKTELTQDLIMSPVLPAATQMADSQWQNKDVVEAASRLYHESIKPASDLVIWYNPDNHDHLNLKMSDLIALLIQYGHHYEYLDFITCRSCQISDSLAPRTLSENLLGGKSNIAFDVDKGFYYEPNSLNKMIMPINVVDLWYNLRYQLRNVDTLSFLEQELLYASLVYQKEKRLNVLINSARMSDEVTLDQLQSSNLYMDNALQVISKESFEEYLVTIPDMEVEDFQSLINSVSQAARDLWKPGQVDFIVVDAEHLSAAKNFALNNPRGSIIYQLVDDRMIPSGENSHEAMVVLKRLLHDPRITKVFNFIGDNKSNASYDNFNEIQKKKIIKVINKAFNVFGISKIDIKTINFFDQTKPDFLRVIKYDILNSLHDVVYDAHQDIHSNSSYVRFWAIENIDFIGIDGALLGDYLVKDNKVAITLPEGFFLQYDLSLKTASIVPYDNGKTIFNLPSDNLDLLESIFQNPKNRLEYITRFSGLIKHLELAVPITKSGYSHLQKLKQHVNYIKNRLSARFGISSKKFKGSIVKVHPQKMKSIVDSLSDYSAEFEILDLPGSEKLGKESRGSILTSSIEKNMTGILDSYVYTSLPDHVLTPKFYGKPSTLRLLLYEGLGHDANHKIKNKQITIVARGWAHSSSAKALDYSRFTEDLPEVSFFTPYGYPLRVLPGAAEHLIDRAGLWRVSDHQTRTALYLTGFDYTKNYEQGFVKELTTLYQQPSSYSDVTKSKPISDILIVDYISRKRKDRNPVETLTLNEVVELLAQKGFNYKQVAVLADRAIKLNLSEKTTTKNYKMDLNLDFNSDEVYYVYGTDNNKLTYGFGVRDNSDDFDLLSVDYWWQGLRYGLLSAKNLNFKQKQILFSSINNYNDIKWYLQAETEALGSTVGPFHENHIPASVLYSVDNYLDAVSKMPDVMFDRLNEEVKKVVSENQAKSNDVHLIFFDADFNGLKEVSKRLAMRNPKKTFIFDIRKNDMTLLPVTENLHHKKMQGNKKYFFDIVYNPKKNRTLTFIGNKNDAYNILASDYYNNKKKADSVKIINNLMKNYKIYPDCIEFINYFDVSIPDYPGDLFKNLGLIHSTEFKPKYMERIHSEIDDLWNEPTIEITTVSDVNIITPLGNMISKLVPNDPKQVYGAKFLVDIVSVGPRSKHLDHVHIDQEMTPWFSKDFLDGDVRLPIEALDSFVKSVKKFLDQYLVTSGTGRLLKSQLITHIKQRFNDTNFHTLESAWSVPTRSLVPTISGPECVGAEPAPIIEAGNTRFKRAVLMDCADGQTFEQMDEVITPEVEHLESEIIKGISKSAVATESEAIDTGERKSAYQLLAKHKEVLVQLAAYPQVKKLGIGKYFEPIIDDAGQLRLISQEQNQLAVSAPLTAVPQDIKDQIQDFNTKFSQLYQALGSQQRQGLSVSHFWLFYAALDYTMHGVSTDIRSLLNAAVFFPSAFLESLHFPVFFINQIKKISVLKNYKKIQKTLYTVNHSSLKVQHLLGNVGKGLHFFGSGVMLYNLVDDLVNKPDFEKSNSEIKTLWSLRTTTDGIFALEAGMSVIDVVSSLSLSGVEFLGPIGLALFAVSETVDLFYKEKHFHKMIESENHWLLEERNHYLSGACRKVLRSKISVLDCSRSLTPVVEINLNQNQGSWRYGKVGISRSVLSVDKKNKHREPVADPDWSRSLNIVPIFQKMATWQQTFEHHYDMVMLPAMPNKQVLYDYTDPGVTTEAINSFFLSTGSMGFLDNNNRVSQLCTGDAFATRSQVLDQLRKTDNPQTLVLCLEVATKHIFCPEIVQLWRGGRACQVGYFKYDLASDIRVATRYRYRYQPTSIVIRLEDSQEHTLVTPSLLVKDYPSVESAKDLTVFNQISGKVKYEIWGNGMKNTLFLQNGFHYDIAAKNEDEIWMLVLPKIARIKKLEGSDDNQLTECLARFQLTFSESDHFSLAENGEADARKATQLCFKGNQEPSVYLVRQ